MTFYNQRHSKSRNRGFTLVELMIVVAILGLLLAIAIPNFQAAQIRAKVASVKANMHSMQVVVEIYATNYAGLYPDNVNIAETEAVDDSRGLPYWVEFSNPMNDLEGKGGSYDDMPGAGLSEMKRGQVYYEVQTNYSTYWIYGAGNENGNVVKNVGDQPLILTNGYTEIL